MSSCLYKQYIHIEVRTLSIIQAVIPEGRFKGTYTSMCQECHCQPFIPPLRLQDPTHPASPTPRGFTVRG